MENEARYIQQAPRAWWSKDDARTRNRVTSSSWSRVCRLCVCVYYVRVNREEENCRHSTAAAAVELLMKLVGLFFHSETEKRRERKKKRNDIPNRTEDVF